MFHHDQRPYAVAVDETAARFEAELLKKVAATRASALHVIERVQREVPLDRLASSRALRFSVEAPGGRLHVTSPGDTVPRPLHRHALSQVASRAGVPDLFVSRLLERGWGPALLADTLNTIFAREPERRFLVRSLHDEIRGVLSDAFRRMDSRPIVDAFAAACDSSGAVPIEGVGGDLRFCIRALLPRVFRPGGDEVVAFGIEMANSDFGAGALSLRCFLLRVWCTNYATLSEELRKVHLGRRLEDGVEFSAETYDLDTRALSSAVKDIVVAAFLPSKLEEQVALIGDAMARSIDLKAALGGLSRAGLSKKEVEAVRDAFNTGGIEQLPPGNTEYRLAHAVSWIAKAAESAERRLELESAAGMMVMGGSRRRLQGSAA